MIQLNDLSKELTEVMDGDLELVVGGGSFNKRGFIGLDGANGQGFSATWKIKDTATTLGGTSNGTLSADTNLNPNLQLTGAVNVGNGAYNANAIWKPNNDFSIGIGGTSNGSATVGLGWTY